MIRETNHKETKEIVVLDKTEYFCDHCNEIIPISLHRIYSNKIQFKHGSSYPEGGNYECEKAYLCNKCAEKLKSVLKGMGVKFEKQLVEW
jgi:hypothetical protein